MSGEGLYLISALLDSDDGVKSFAELEVYEDELLPSESEVWEFVTSFVMKHGKVPSLDALETKFPDLNLPDAPDPPSYYAEKIRRRHTYRVLTTSINEAGNFLTTKAAGFEPEKALEILSEAVTDLLFREHKGQIVDFRDAYDIVFAEYKKALGGDTKDRLLTGWPTFDAKTGGMTFDDILSVVGRPAQGKAQPLDAPVLTLSGWKNMGHLNVGDKLASVDGKESHVTGIFPQGIKQTYWLSFTDGRKIEACVEHLWEVTHHTWGKSRILPTEKLVRMLNHKRYQKRLQVRLFSGDYGRKYDRRISPWLLGLLLGDGCLTQQVSFSTADSKIIDQVQLLALDLEVKHRGNYDYALVGNQGESNWIKEELKSLGMWGKVAQQKFVPKVFFDYDYQTRIGLLQGLMDSDGWVQKDGAMYFGSSSLQLAQDVQRLVRSLGGIASLYESTNDSWRVGIKMPNPKTCFTLTRKKDRCKNSPTHQGKKTTLKLVLENIEPARKVECQCISVSHDYELYVGQDYVVTHNTYNLLKMMHHAWSQQGKSPLFVSMEMTPTPLIQRLAAMHTHFNVSKLKKGEFSTKKKGQLFSVLKGLKSYDRPMWVVDGAMAATLEDIWSLCQQLKPDCVFIDGAYMLGHKNRRLNKWERIGENAEGIKKILAKELQVPVVASYQFGKQAAKKGKKEVEVGLEDVYGSDVIAQVSSLVVGLMEEENVESMKQKKVTILKGREGGSGEFYINWMFDTMNFEEIDLSEKEGKDLEFM